MELICLILLIGVWASHPHMRLCSRAIVQLANTVGYMTGYIWKMKNSDLRWFMICIVLIEAIYKWKTTSTTTTRNAEQRPTDLINNCWVLDADKQIWVDLIYIISYITYNPPHIKKTHFHYSPSLPFSFSNYLCVCLHVGRYIWWCYFLILLFTWGRGRG